METSSEWQYSCFQKRLSKTQQTHKSTLTKNANDALRQAFYPLPRRGETQQIQRLPTFRADMFFEILWIDNLSRTVVHWEG